jgi:hypothetical protein
MWYLCHHHHDYMLRAGTSCLVSSGERASSLWLWWWLPPGQTNHQQSSLYKRKTALIDLSPWSIASSPNILRGVQTIMISCDVSKDHSCILACSIGDVVARQYNKENVPQNRDENIVVESFLAGFPVVITRTFSRRIRWIAYRYSGSMMLSHPSSTTTSKNLSFVSGIIGECGTISRIGWSSFSMVERCDDAFLCLRDCARQLLDAAPGRKSCLANLIRS